MRGPVKLIRCRVGKGAFTRRAHAFSDGNIDAWAWRCMIARGMADAVERAFAHPTLIWCDD
jgi:hypothetical protein